MWHWNAPLWHSAPNELARARRQHMLTVMKAPPVAGEGPDGQPHDEISELASIAVAKRELARREEVAVRRARQKGLSWAEIGVLLGVTRQTMHRKYGKRT